MESIKVIVLLSIFSGLFLRNSNAQFTPAMKIDLLTGRTKFQCNSYNSPAQINGICLFSTKDPAFSKKPNCLFTFQNPKCDNFLKISAGKTAVPSYDNSLTFNAKWERLTGKPIIDTSKAYYFPVKRTNNPDIFNTHFYRTGASIFNMVVNAKYPSLSQPK